LTAEPLPERETSAPVSTQPALEEKDWDLIVRRIKSQKCVPFLGAGASTGSGTREGLPTGQTLADRLALECEYPGKDTTDLLRVAQYYTIKYDAQEVRDSISKQLNLAGASPSPVHHSFAAMPFPFVLTTNFDEFMEDAFRARGKAPRVALYEPHGDGQALETPNESAPLVYKLHGCVTKPHTMITTEDDVTEFLACLLMGDPDLPVRIKELFENYSILFVGYGLRDWNIRVMLRALRGRRMIAHSELSCFAIQRSPEEPALKQEWQMSVMYWSKRESLRCFDADAFSFAEELLQRVERSQ
jgi:hypothetical protein